MTESFLHPTWTERVPDLAGPHPRCGVVWYLTLLQFFCRKGGLALYRILLMDWTGLGWDGLGFEVCRYNSSYAEGREGV